MAQCRRTVHALMVCRSFLLDTACRCHVWQKLDKLLSTIRKTSRCPSKLPRIETVSAKSLTRTYIDMIWEPFCLQYSVFYSILHRLPMLSTRQNAQSEVVSSCTPVPPHQNLPPLSFFLRSVCHCQLAMFHRMRSFESVGGTHVPKLACSRGTPYKPSIAVSAVFVFVPFPATSRVVEWQTH